jgi:flavodoxin
MTDALNETESVHIIFSTQSGRAKACARRCARLIREQTRVGVRPGSAFDDDVCTNLIDWCQKLRTSKSLLVLFVSTTGDGEHTDTIQRTWKQL